MGDMNLQIFRNHYKDQVMVIANHCMVDDIRIFGSILDTNLSEASDIDFLVKMKPNSGFAIGGLKWRLEELLHRRVDVVLENALHPLIKEQILKEARHL